VTHTYIKSAWQSLLRSSSEASAAGRLRPNAETAEVRTGLGFRDSQEVILRVPCISLVPLCSWQLHFYSGIVEGKPKFSTDLVVLGILLKHVTG
jgi:hypothetical protein